VKRQPNVIFAIDCQMFNIHYFENIQSNQEEKATSILSLYDQLHEKKGNSHCLRY